MNRIALCPDTRWYKIHCLRLIASIFVSFVRLRGRDPLYDCILKRVHWLAISWLSGRSRTAQRGRGGGVKFRPIEAVHSARNLELRAQWGLIWTCLLGRLISEFGWETMTKTSPIGTQHHWAHLPLLVVFHYSTDPNHPQRRLRQTSLAVTAK